LYIPAAGHNKQLQLTDALTFAPLTMMICPLGSSTASFMLRPYGIASRVLQHQHQQRL
jgi:hypothetical protein